MNRNKNRKPLASAAKPEPKQEAPTLNKDASLLLLKARAYDLMAEIDHIQRAADEQLRPRQNELSQITAGINKLSLPEPAPAPAEEKEETPAEVIPPAGEAETQTIEQEQ